MDDRELLGRIAEKVGKIDVLVEAQKHLEVMRSLASRPWKRGKIRFKGFGGAVRTTTISLA